MKKILIIISIIVLLLVINENNKDYYVIPNESIRLRIIANSNSVYDQYVKNKVKNNLEEELIKATTNTNSIIEARLNIKNNINNYTKKISSTIEEIGYDKTFTINYGSNYFPEKKYKGVIYKEGNYESLVVKLGKGEGNNWWCVLYPPICTLEVEEYKEVEYKFFIKELFEKYFK